MVITTSQFWLGGGVIRARATISKPVDVQHFDCLPVQALRTGFSHMAEVETRECLAPVPSTGL
jgi:hypothetical protein